MKGSGLANVDYFRNEVYERLPALVEKFGTPFHLYSKPAIKRTGERMIAAFSSIPYRQYFAVKACPEPWIMEFLFKELGFGFDCSSVAEIVMAQAVGARGEDIMFTSNDTSSAEFEAALKAGVILNLDDASFLDRLQFRSRSMSETICFRINPGRRRTGNSIIGQPYKSKYGVPYKDIVGAYRRARGMGAKHFGIHMMVCSNERHSPYFVETAQECLKLAEMLYRLLDIKVKFVNIGGGFGTPYKPGQEEVDLEWVGRVIAKLFQAFGSKFGFMPELMTECGRYVTGPNGILVNRVLHVMQKYRHFIGVEAAMTGCPRPAFYGAYHHIEVLDPGGKLRIGPKSRTNVVGPKCENWDRLTPVDEERFLPVSTGRGDLLITHNCGAHSGAMADNYNGRLRIQGLLDQDGTDGNVIQIRRAETLEDLFGTIVPSPNFWLPGQPKRKR